MWDKVLIYFLNQMTLQSTRYSKNQRRKNWLSVSTEMRLNIDLLAEVATTKPDRQTILVIHKMHLKEINTLHDLRNVHFERKHKSKYRFCCYRS
jgi:hypothetical protein